MMSGSQDPRSSHSAFQEVSSTSGTNLAVPIPIATASSSQGPEWSLSPPIASSFNTQHRDSFVHRQELENAFYRDLICCNQRMRDLHHLLRHYEETHYGQSLPRDNAEPAFPPMFRQVPTEPPQTTTDPGLMPVTSSEEEGVFEVTELTTATTTTTNQLISSHRSSAFRPVAPLAVSEPQEKPYKCPVPGCYKSYKNANGLKYHREHGHQGDQDDDNAKPFRCPVASCRKRYKQMSGLKYHMAHSHLDGLMHVQTTDDYPMMDASEHPLTPVTSSPSSSRYNSRAPSPTA